MTRKLLPYEYDLIQQLGVTEDEYLDFIEVQFNYELSAAERIAKPQCEPISTAFLMTSLGLATFAETLIVAAVLIAPGILFQVAAMLLMPKPSLPGGGGNRAREQRFSPRFGFNSSQELGQYGDPINLVYCNTNDNRDGGVRIGTSLVWSSVESYGSTQFMQLLLVLGAARIKTLDFERTAFGQLPLGQFSASNTWLYYEDNGNVKFNDKKLGDNSDPTSDGVPNSENVCQVMFAGNRRDGYSQAFSPSSLTSIGVYDPIPLNVEIMERSSEGNPRWRDLRVTIQTNGYNTNDGARWKKDATFTVIFNKTDTKRDERVAVEAARDMRYQLVESLDRSATYMLGTAKFRLLSVNEGAEVNLDERNVTAKFECIEAGRRPSTDYTKTKSKLWTEQDRQDIEDAIDQLEAGSPLSLTGAAFSDFVLSKSYSISSTTDEVGVEDVVLRPVDWLNEANIAYWNGDITLKLQIYGYKNYNFKGNETVKWKDELDKIKIATFPKGGSIATTEAILQEVLFRMPKLNVSDLRNEIKDDMRRLQNLIDSIQADKIEGEEIRKLAKQAGSTVATAINLLQAKYKDKIKTLDIDKTQLENVKKASTGNVEVLSKKTGLTKGQLEDLFGLSKEIDKLQDQRQDLISGDIATRKAELISLYRNESSPFTNRGKTDNNRYGSGGIKAMERRLSQLKGQLTTDQIGAEKVRKFFTDLVEEKKEALKDAKKVYNNWEDLAGGGDDNFFTKCLVKVESAAYETVTACDFVKFAIRCKIFRRVSGRANDYGQNEAPEGFKLSDNGVKGRMAFFKVLYKKTKAPDYQGLPIVFAVRRNADQDNFIGLAFKGNERTKWQFKIEPIGDTGAELQDSGQTQVAFIENAGNIKTYPHAGSSFAWTGSLVNISSNIKNALKERGPIYTNEWDLFSVRSDSQVQFSFDGGPEFRITSVTEQQVIATNAEKTLADKNYKNMSTMALGVFSGRGVQDLRSITAYVTEGKICHTITEAGDFKVGTKYQIVQVGSTNFTAIGASSNTVGRRFTATAQGSGSGIATAYEAGSSSFAPDIFADTILDTENGIGKFAKSEGIDWNGIALAKEFCKNNGLGCQLFMDGVIAEQTPWRQFWAETAPFSLLEFARVGGRETLIPAVPVNAAGVANREVLVNALFTAGNVLEGSYKEEFIDYGSAVQDLIATVIYRDTESQDVFPRNSSVTVSLQNADDGTAILQSFDLSQFVTQRKQAILFAKLLCNQRRHIRRGIEFKTFPTDTPISPGAYIYVDIGLNTWERISSGLIMQGGELNAPLLPRVPDGTYSVLMYRDDRKTLPYKGPGGETLYEPTTIARSNVSVSNGVAAELAPYAGYMFVLGAQSNKKRVFRVTEVQMDEEGEVTIKAMEHPCEDSGGKLLSRIANFSDSLFDVR
jgi:hypothetical protein